MLENKKIFVNWEAGGEKKVLDATKLIISFAVIIGAAIYAFISQDWISGITVIFLALALVWYLFSVQKPLKMSIGDAGISIEERVYGFEAFKSYWFSPDNNTLYMIPKSKIGAILPVMLGSRKAEDITKFFPKTIIQTENRGKDMADTMSDFLHK